MSKKHQTLGELIGQPLDDRSAGLNGCDPAPAVPITLADCRVTDAKGRETRHGIAFSGVLWIRDVKVADFRNAGNGGCHVWTVRDLKLFAEFESLAKAHLPEVKFEQADLVVGDLWDAAFTAGK